MDGVTPELEAACRSLGSPDSAARARGEAFLDHFKSLSPAVSVPTALHTAGAGRRRAAQSRIRPVGAAAS